MDKNQIKSIILKESRSCILRRPKVHLADKVYDQCDYMQVKHELAKYVDKLPYKPDRNDCDDATFRLLGYLKNNIRGALGFAWSSSHSFVVFIYADRLWVIEPYGKGIMTYQEARKDPFKRYKPLKLVVI